MKLIFILHGVPDGYKRDQDLYASGKKPAIRIKQYDFIGTNFEKTVGILWFTDTKTNETLNTEAGWRFYTLKKL